MRAYAETLDAEFYRQRAHLCHKLADASQAAKPIFARLYFLAKAYEEKAAAAESKLAGGQATESPRSPSELTSPPSML
jgi:hypothetical protein